MQQGMRVVVGSPHELGNTETTELDVESKEGEAVPASCDEVLEGIGFGRFQWQLMLLCGLVWLADGAEMFGMKYIYVELDDVWGTDTKEWGIFKSATNLCKAGGAFVLGAASDKYGRRQSLIGSLAVAATFGCLSATARGFASLLVVQCLSSIGTGACLPVAISLLADHVPPSSRDACMVLMQVFFAAGDLLSLSVALALPHWPGRWRLFLLAIAAPSVALAAARRLIPESPAHLLRAGRREEAMEKLSAVALMNGTFNWKVKRQLAQLRCKEADDKSARAAAAGYEGLLSPSLRWRLALFASIWVGATMGSDFWGWVTEIGHAWGLKQEMVESMLIACRFVGVAGFLSAASLSRGGQGRPVLRAALVGCVVVSATMYLVVMAAEGAYALVPLGLCTLAMAFTFDMVWGLLYATTSSCFDAPCRASSLAACSGMSRATATVVPLLTGTLQAQPGGEPKAFLFWAVGWCCALCAVFSVQRAMRNDERLGVKAAVVTST